MCSGKTSTTGVNKYSPKEEIRDKTDILKFHLEKKKKGPKIPMLQKLERRLTLLLFGVCF